MHLRKKGLESSLSEGPEMGANVVCSVNYMERRKNRGKQKEGGRVRELGPARPGPTVPLSI